MYFNIFGDSTDINTAQYSPKHAISRSLAPSLDSSPGGEGTPSSGEGTPSPRRTPHPNQAFWIRPASLHNSSQI